MTKKIYKCNIYIKALYGMMTVGILILGLWAMFFGIEKRVYNLPLLAVGLILCIYSMVILLKFFTYKVVMTDQFIKIYDFSKTRCIYYQNIIDIKISGNICYIVDRISTDGRFYIRGTNTAAEYSTGGIVSINASRIPSIKKAYIDGYNEIVEALLLKCGMGSAGEIALSSIRRNSYFSSLSLFEEFNSKKEGFRMTLEILSPYLFMVLMFLLSMLVFGTTEKGSYHSWMVISLKLVFLLYIITSIYVLIVRFIPLIKKVVHNKPKESRVGLREIILFLTVNTIISVSVIAFFFYVLKNYSS